MAGFKIGIGVGLSYPMNNPNKGQIRPPTYLSCFGTGVWEKEGYWFGNDIWKMQSTNPPFLPSGIWNNEGVYRFKDTFNFGASFLPTGFILFDLIFRYEDKIKIEYEMNNALLQEDGGAILLEDVVGYLELEGDNLAKSKSYWNF